MNSRAILSVLLLFALLLSACQSAAPTAQSPAAEPADSNTSNEQKSGGAYPEPQQAETTVAPEAYPAPQEKSVEVSAPAAVLYPDPQSGDEVTWNQAYAMMRNGEVTQILKSSTGMLTLTLKDGRALTVKEPAAGDLETALGSCGAPCEDITTQTE